MDASQKIALTIVQNEAATVKAIRVLKKKHPLPYRSYYIMATFHSYRIMTDVLYSGIKVTFTTITGKTFRYLDKKRIDGLVAQGYMFKVPNPKFKNKDLNFLYGLTSEGFFLCRDLTSEYNKQLEVLQHQVGLIDN